MFAIRRGSVIFTSIRIKISEILDFELFLFIIQFKIFHVNLIFDLE